MDSNVLAAQKYLNAMFGGHPSWKPLEEDGWNKHYGRHHPGLSNS